MNANHAHQVADWLERVEMPGYPHDYQDPSELLRTLADNAVTQQELLLQALNAMEDFFYHERPSATVDAMAAIRRHISGAPCQTKED